MSYRDIIGFINPDDKDSINDVLVKRNRNASKGYDFVRLGLPNGAVDFVGTKIDRELLVHHLIHHGWGSWPYMKIDKQFAKHVALFRSSLDLWEEFSKDKVFSKEEIYHRCLTEGHSFTEYIKECRSTCLRALTAETDTEVDEEYFHAEYTGYNSIIHEKYLINWNACDEVEDYLYAFIPPREKQRNIEIFRKYLRDMFKEYRIDELDAETEIDMIKGLQPSKIYDPAKGKTFLMRDMWNDSFDARGPYYAKRVVIPVEAGNIRDTGIGEPGSIIKVKMLNMLCRIISERLPHSANADGPTANARLKRVLKKNNFLHLDFKKFGLTFPRRLQNVVIEEIGRVLKVDTSHLIIDDFFLEVDGEALRTERGSVLGWMDPVGALAVSAILCHLSREGLAFDHIIFNDDVEISKSALSDRKTTLELLRSATIAELDSWDIPISIKKTYGSRASVFLERYAYFRREYSLDMYKEQLTVSAYAKSLVTDEIWHAKMLFAAAWMWTKSEYARDRCMDTCPIEFRKEEIYLPIWAGGWYLPIKGRLDHSLNQIDRIGLRLGINLSKYKAKLYSSKVGQPSSYAKIERTLEKRINESSSAELVRLTKNIDLNIDEINEEVEYYSEGIETLVSIYCGRNEEFPLHIVRLVKACRTVFDPG